MIDILQGLFNLLLAFVLFGLLPAVIGWGVLSVVRPAARWARAAVGGVTGAAAAFGITYGFAAWDAARQSAQGVEICGAGAAAMLFLIAGATFFHFLIGIVALPRIRLAGRIASSDGGDRPSPV